MYYNVIALSRDFSIVTSRLIIIVVEPAPFLRLTPLCFYAPATIDIHLARTGSSECVSETQRDLKYIIANWDAVSILLSEYGQDMRRTCWLTISLDAARLSFCRIEETAVISTASRPRTSKKNAR